MIYKFKLMHNLKEAIKMVEEMAILFIASLGLAIITHSITIIFWNYSVYIFDTKDFKLFRKLDKAFLIIFIT